MNNVFRKKIVKTSLFFVTIFLLFLTNILLNNCWNNQCNYPSSIFVPRQLSYNPIFENALLFSQKNIEHKKYVISVKPIWTQSVGQKFSRYFNICHKPCLTVKEDGSGDINSLWFDLVMSDTSSFYSSDLTFCPKRKTYGSMIYFSAKPTEHFEVSLNTAIISTRNNMNICENNIQNFGVCENNRITQSLASCQRKFGRINGTQEKIGLDDIQLKFIYNSYDNQEEKDLIWSAYGLIGIPTGRGSKGTYLFEPLVGSKHAQIGLGSTIHYKLQEKGSCLWQIIGEAKYRYAFSGKECRSFDLCKNGQWSRYMLFVNESDKYNPYPAINNLTMPVQVKPGSSLDIYLATNFNHSSWSFELGYDLWYRTCEKICPCCKTFPTVGIADLLGIAKLNPKSASAANISQGVQPNINQMTSDSTFIPVTLCDINLASGAQTKNISNSLYGSIGYKFETIDDNALMLGLSCDYEIGHACLPDNVTTWLNFDVHF